MQSLNAATCISVKAAHHLVDQRSACDCAETRQGGFPLRHRHGQAGEGPPLATPLAVQESRVLSDTLATRGDDHPVQSDHPDRLVVGVGEACRADHANGIKPPIPPDVPAATLASEYWRYARYQER